MCFQGEEKGAPHEKGDKHEEEAMDDCLLLGGGERLVSTTET